MREGFFEPAHFEAVRARLPEPIQTVVTFAYLTGWRVNSEAAAERVAMTMSGHQTREVFERYNIVSDGDLDEAARRLDAAAVTATVTETVTLSPRVARRSAAALAGAHARVAPGRARGSRSRARRRRPLVRLTTHRRNPFQAAE